MDNDKISERKLEIKRQLNALETQITELKSRWPFHSVQPKMVAELEDLEEERERILNLLSQNKLD